MQHDRILDYGEKGVAIKDNIETISIKWIWTYIR